MLLIGILKVKGYNFVVMIFAESCRGIALSNNKLLKDIGRLLSLTLKY